MPDERRTGPPSRRSEDLTDWRLEELEQGVAEVRLAVALEHLDRRYMPRDEMNRAFIPRVEHEHKRETAVRNLGVLLVVAQLIETAVIALVISGSH